MNQLHDRFLGILPRIQTHARIYFRDIKCHVRRADCIAEAVALAWKWFVRLARRGKDATQFPSTLATFAVKWVRCGRRLTGQERSKDVLSPLAQRRRNFAVGKLPDFATLNGNPLEEALVDNTRSPVPDQVQFRLDFPVWRASHSHRDRRIIDAMAMNERTLDLAATFGLSPGRISQKREEFKKDWLQFTDQVESVP